MTPKQALKRVEKSVWAGILLRVHGALSDSESDRVDRRIDTWAKERGLRRKGP